MCLILSINVGIYHRLAKLGLEKSSQVENRSMYIDFCLYYGWDIYWSPDLTHLIFKSHNDAISARSCPRQTL